MRIGFIILMLIIINQKGYSQSFEYKLPKEPNKYSSDVIKVDRYEMKSEQFDTINLNSEYEIQGLPNFQMEFENGILKNYSTANKKLLTIFEYNSKGNLENRRTIGDNYEEILNYKYDFEQMKLEVVRNGNQTFFIKYFDSKNRVIKETNFDTYTKKKRNTTTKNYYDGDYLKFQEFYVNEKLTRFSSHFYDIETNKETVLTFDETGNLKEKKINLFSNNDDLFFETTYDGNDNEKMRWINVVFRDERGNPKKKYRINTTKKVIFIYEYKIEYKK